MFERYILYAFGRILKTIFSFIFKNILFYRSLLEIERTAEAGSGS